MKRKNSSEKEKLFKYEMEREGYMSTWNRVEKYDKKNLIRWTWHEGECVFG